VAEHEVLGGVSLAHRFKAGNYPDYTSHASATQFTERQLLLRFKKIVEIFAQDIYQGFFSLFSQNGPWKTLFCARLPWNRWPLWRGIGGHFAVEYAPRNTWTISPNADEYKSRCITAS
jgi:hypothetical protein